MTPHEYTNVCTEVTHIDTPFQKHTSSAYTKPSGNDVSVYLVLLSLVVTLLGGFTMLRSLIYCIIRKDHVCFVRVVDTTVGKHVSCVQVYD